MNRRPRLLVAVPCAPRRCWCPRCGGRQQPAADRPRRSTRRPARRAAGSSPSRRATRPASTTSLGGGLAELISHEHPAARRRPPRPAPPCRTSSSWSRASTTSPSRWPTRAADAVSGQGAFTAPQDVQALARIYSNYTHVVVQRRPASRTMADFRGKRISTGSPEVRHRGDRQPAAAGRGARPGHRRHRRSVSSSARPSTR